MHPYLYIVFFSEISIDRGHIDVLTFLSLILFASYVTLPGILGLAKSKSEIWSLTFLHLCCVINTIPKTFVNWANNN